MFRILGPILSILIAFAAFFFFVKPIYTEVQAVQAETKAYEEASAKATEFNTLLTSLLQKKNSFNALELDRLETLVPGEIDGVKALVDLERLAGSQGLIFNHVAIDLLGGEGEDDSDEEVVVTEDGLGTLDISFNVVGTYADFKSFLESLEKSLVLMDVTEIAFQTAEGELTNYTVTVRLYALSTAP